MHFDTCNMETLMVYSEPKNDPSCFSGNTAGEIIDEEDFKFNLSGIIGKRVLMCY